jgi:glycosyltransferase involved in cell wall biosynthesis
MKLGVVISTYYRPDGRTKEFLTRTLNSVKNQKHQDFKIYLIGDKYEKNDEFIELCQIIEPEKIYYENLKEAKERDKYISGDKLWCSGGVNAKNYGIEKCLSDGIEYICNLDHDDFWYEDHLSSINSVIESGNYNFISTKSNYLNLYSVPIHSRPGQFFPVAGDITHSATCVNYKNIPLRYRDVFESTGRVYASDADLWNRITEYLISNKQFGFLIDKVTILYDKKERE